VKGTYPNVKGLVGVRTGSTKSEEFGPGVVDGDLEVIVCVFLLKNDSHRLLYVDQEATRSRRGDLIM
jgi:hypothetical protein